MQFDNEEALQDFLISYLESKGIDCIKEYRLPDRGRIDILTAHHVIKCKPYLTSTDLYKASGQLLTR